MKKTVILLSGPSGCGKSTTIQPKLKEALGARVIDTGCVFKSLLGGAIDPQRVFGSVDQLYLGDDALKFMLASGAIDRGCEVYEESFKPQFGGFTTCLFPEAGQRAVHPDGPVILAAKLTMMCPENVVVCDVINYQEATAFRDMLQKEGHSVILVRLKCDNPLRRSGGDNRRLITLEESQQFPWVLNVSYTLETLDSALPPVVEALRTVIIATPDELWLTSLVTKLQRPTYCDADRLVYLREELNLPKSTQIIYGGTSGNRCFWSVVTRGAPFKKTGHFYTQILGSTLLGG